MIDNRYTVLSMGYDTKSEAYEEIRSFYSDLKGVTTYYSEGKWYVVQSKSLM